MSIFSYHQLSRIKGGLLMSSKQVIVVRTDLNMPVGKVAAQVAHASMSVILNRMITNDGRRTLPLEDSDPHSEHIADWLDGAFTKVVVGIGSEEELLHLYNQAIESGLPCSKIVDSGRTVFDGVATLTCCAFGPSSIEQIDLITKGLRLLR